MTSRLNFFENPDSNIPFTFTKPDSKAHRTILESPSVIQSFAACTCSDSKLNQSGVYALHQDFLVYYQEGNKTTPTSLVNIKHAKVSPLDSNSSNGFTLTKNKTSITILFPRKQSEEDWRKALRSVCVMTDYKQRFQQCANLGRGSFAKVFLTYCETEDKYYAAKCITKPSKDTKNLQTSLINEVNILRSLDHPNIISLHEVHETDHKVYLLMEYTQSQTLGDILISRNFKESYSDDHVMFIIHSLLDALSYLASKGIMHRDLKPDNILVEKGGKVKIIDFGLAEYVNNPIGVHHQCGTPGFIAPEVFRFNKKNPATKYDHSCDMFSLGCILFYMIFKKPLFTGKRLSRVFAANKEFSDIKVLYTLLRETNTNPQLNKDGIALLMDLLQSDPKKRVSVGDALVHAYFKSIINQVLGNYAKCQAECQLFDFRGEINPFLTSPGDANAKTCLPDEDIASLGEVDEVEGNENCHIQDYFAKYMGDQKHPSKLKGDPLQYEHCF